MLLGTAGAFVAAQSGEAAEGAIETPAAEAVIERHEELAKITEGSFAGLTALFAAIVFVPRLLRRPLPRPAGVATGLVFLVLYAAAAVVLANTAHQGGRLVHELGVRNPAAAGVIAGVVFLALYFCAAAVLANTAHQGGRLVHELGVHNPAAAGTPEAVASGG
jgi:uncharacterized membrane protein